MVVFNPQKKEIDIKVVYYGPALCGKTTNLKSVHLNLNPQQRGDLISLATKDDRTLFFDFLPIQLENIKGFKTRFHIYTVPGQVFYTLTRKAVLTGVDGVIFVADSQNGKMRENIESLNDLKDNLKYYNKTLDSIPLVLQYNKRDMPGLMSVAEMNEQLNGIQAPYFESCALSGKGVMETLTMCCKMVLKQMQNKSKADRPANRAAADTSAVEQTATELPQLTLAEGSPAEVDAVEGQPLQRTEAQPISDSESAESIDLKTIKASPMGHDHSSGHSAAPGDSAGISFAKERAAEEIKERPHTPAMETLGSHERKNEDGKKICPRCSLKFKPNVKQCPICRISLVPEELSAVITARESTGEEVPPPAGDTKGHDHPSLTGYRISDGNHNGHQIEFVSCEQPLKASPHAIVIPLVMRIKDSNEDVKVELTISINKTHCTQQC